MPPDIYRGEGGEYLFDTTTGSRTLVSRTSDTSLQDFDSPGVPMSTTGYPIRQISITAVGAVARYAPVNAARQQAAAGEPIAGFAQTDTTYTQQIVLAVSGTSEALAGAAITVLDELQVGAGGTVVPRTTGSSIGRAMASAAQGDEVEVQFLGVPISGGAPATPLTLAGMQDALDAGSPAERAEFKDSVSGYAPATIPGATILCAHRGSMLIHQENSLRAFQASYASGVKYIELDVLATLGGGAVVMHDSDVSRTTDGTAGTLVSALSPDQAIALNIDALSTVAPGYRKEKVPMLEEVLDWAAGKDVVLIVEIKEAAAETPLLRELQARRYPVNNVIVESTQLSWCLRVIAAGYRCMHIVYDLTSYDFAAAKTAGWHSVGANWPQWTLARAGACRTAGLQSWAWTVNRRRDLATIVAAGVDGVMSDDVPYLATALPISTKDQFAAGRFQHGHIGNDSEDPVAAGRGRFFTTGEWGFNQIAAHYGALMGSMCPVKGDPASNSHTISFDLQFDSASDETRWVGVHICGSDDGPHRSAVSGKNGYNVLVRKNGTLNIFQTNGGGAGTETSIATTVGTSLSLATKYAVSITVTPTSVSVSCNGFTASVTNSAYRGGYFQLGCSGAQVRFSALQIT